MIKCLRPTYAEVDLSAIRFNIESIKKTVGENVRVMPAVKADGYGHGAVEVSKACLSAGADILCVSSAEEGIELREAGIDSPILLLGASHYECIEEIIDYNFISTICDIDFAKMLNERAQNKQKKAYVHVKIDTGMGRIGVDYSCAYNFIVSLKEFDWMELEGIFTHFASSDEGEKTFTYLQISRFNSLIDELSKNNMKPEYIHASNSGGILSFPEAYYNAVRPGITVYGCYPSEETPKNIILKPALTLKSKITFLREAKKGTTVSYGCTHRLTKDSKIAVLPVGYADGYSRFLSNKGEVAIRGQKAPVVGRVCMDQIMVDVSDIDGVCIGDEAILYGGGYDYLNVSKIAEKIGTINYEVFCNISKRVPRVYINN